MQQRLQQMLGERTLVLFKPDALKRGLVGPIFQRFEQTGLKIVACKMVVSMPSSFIHQDVVRDRLKSLHL